jgi:hypothetical protein
MPKNRKSLNLMDFKLKSNCAFNAKEVALGYTQVSGKSSMDNYLAIVNDKVILLFSEFMKDRRFLGKCLSCNKNGKRCVAVLCSSPVEFLCH